MGLLAGLFGAASFFAAEWPVRRRIEVKPGVFVEASPLSDAFFGVSYPGNRAVDIERLSTLARLPRIK